MKPTDITDFLGITNTKKGRPVEPEKVGLDRENLGPKKILMEWEAIPDAPTTKLNSRNRKTLMIIGGAVGLFLLLMGEIFLLILIASIIFFTYVMANNPLEAFKYEISNHGINVGGTFYYWDEFERFFFTEHYGAKNIAVDMKEGFPSRIILAFHPEDREKIKEIMNQHLVYLEKEPINFVDKAYKSVADRFDFEGNK